MNIDKIIELINAGKGLFIFAENGRNSGDAIEHFEKYGNALLRNRNQKGGLFIKGKDFGDRELNELAKKCGFGKSGFFGGTKLPKLPLILDKGQQISSDDFERLTR